MAQRNKLNRKVCARLCSAFFGGEGGERGGEDQFEWATAFSVHLLLLAQTNKAEQKEAVSFTAFVSMKYLIHT